MLLISNLSIFYFLVKFQTFLQKRLWKFRCYE